MSYWRIETLDALIVGGGVVGLAAAAEIGGRGRSVVLAECRPRPGMETSTHNSGVIHAGLYYPAGSLKASLCVEGARRMYDFCATHGIPHERCGKLVIGTTDEEVAQLDALLKRAQGNGVEGVAMVDSAFIRAREPHVRGRGALWSPNSGRLEAEMLIRALVRLAESRDAIVLPSTRVARGERRGDAFEVATERETIRVRVVVNAAGLYADDVSKAMGGEIFTIYPCRGEYAELRRTRTSWINGLVYPLPHASGHGLGTHLTKTTSGNVLLGPTIRYQKEKDDYERDRLPLESYVAPSQHLCPELTLEDLTYGGSGIRAKLHPPEESFADFLIRHDALQPGLIHAAGIDSPGLTSSLAIGTRVASLVEEILA